MKRHPNTSQWQRLVAVFRSTDGSRWRTAAAIILGIPRGELRTTIDRTDMTHDDLCDLERKLMDALEQRAIEVKNYIGELRSLHGEIDAEQDARIRRVNRQAALAGEPTWRQIFSKCSWGPEYLEQHGAEVDEMDELDRKHAAERMAA